MCTPQAVLDTIIEKIVETVIQSVALHVGFLFQYKKNLKTLEAEITNLEEQIEKIKLKVNEALTCGEEVDDHVSTWQDMVGKKVEEFKDYKTVNDNMQCFKFSCPDYISRYRTSKEVVNKIGEVKNLTHSGNFSTVAHPKPTPKEFQFLPSANYASFESRELVFNSIMEAVQDFNVKIIGVYGIGGVGKTTMVEEVGNQVKMSGLFDEVVVAVVSQDVNVSKIQGQLAGRLGLNLNAANEVDGKAIQLWKRLNNGKKNLIILDDIWQDLDLKKIGIPITDENKYCKVVITSRIVLENMQVDKFFSIQVLSEKEAWVLFKKKVGDSVDSPQLHDIADAVCKECGGLPIAILAVGAALKYKDKDIYAWQDALYQLKNSNLKNIEGIDQKVYSSLKFSYDWLQSEDAKLCFLLCCLFPEDDEISIDDLVRQCIARRLLDPNMGTLETRRHRVLTVVKTLKTCCLLIEGNDENIVKMHDVIRDVAISIAKDDAAFLVKHGVQEWPEKDTYESSSAISLRSECIHEVPNELGCPQLHTLLLECSENTSVIVPNMFFSGMEKLIILYLGQVHMLQLPTSLAKLVNLRMLCLNECKLEDIAILKDLKKTLEILDLRGSNIKVLPSEIGQLTHLRLLDLRDCEELTKIPQGVISKLSRLEELYILNSFEQWEVTTTNMKKSNVSLDELSKLTRLTTLHIHIPNVMLLPKDLCFENLIRFCISVGCLPVDRQSIPYKKYSRVFGLVGASLMDQFNVLLERAELLNLRSVVDFQEVHHYRGGEGFSMQHRRLNTSRSFNKLTVLSINYCRLKYLFSPSCARGILQLQELKIGNCEIMEEIVGIEEEKDEEDLMSQVINFSQLKHMRLYNLPNLLSFCLKVEKTTSEENSSTHAQSLFNEKVTFPALEELYIDNLQMITEIWDKKLLQSEFFCQLRTVDIHGCDNLVNVLSSNMLQRREIVEDNDNIISFPQLRTLMLTNLQSFKCFCTSRFETQFLFNSQVAFPVLENLQIIQLRYIIEIWSKQSLIILEKESKSFCQLKTLNVQHCPKLEVIVPEKEEEKGPTNDDIIVFSQLTTLYLVNLMNLKSFYSWPTRSEALTLFNDQVSFPVLEELNITRMPDIIKIWDKQLLITSIKESKSFYQLKELRVFDCPKLEVIVMEKEEEKGPTNDDIIVFSQLTTLHLSNLMNLKSFCSRPIRSEAQTLFNDQVAFPKLEHLFLDKCVNSSEIHPWNVLAGKISLNALKVDNCEQVSTVASPHLVQRLQNIHTLIVTNCSEVTQVFQLEGLNVGEGRHVRPLTEVRRMELDGLPQLTCLWNKDPLGILGLQSLQYLTIKKCSLLRNLFTRSIAMALEQLKVLYLKSCPMMEEVIATDEGHKEVTGDEIEFPKLEWLILKDLPNLNSFCNANYNFNLPSLQRVVLKRCPKIQTFTYGQVHMSQILLSTRGDEGLHTDDLNRYLEQRLLNGENVQPLMKMITEAKKKSSHTLN